ncbi:MAG: twin-arginine translocase TatA/TatE family subunit [Woeseiaceae bacterium]
MEWSGPELILLFVIALVVLGPERMAQVAKKVGQFVGYARRMSRNLQVQLEDELEMQQIRDSLPTRVDLKKELGIDKLEKDINKLNEPVLPKTDRKPASSDDSAEPVEQQDPAAIPSASTADPETEALANIGIETPTPEPAPELAAAAETTKQS